MNSDKCMDILTNYISSIFQDFESFVRSEVAPVEDDIRLLLDDYISSFITYELQPSVYTSKDISESFCGFSNLNMKYFTTQLISNLRRLP